MPPFSLPQHLLWEYDLAQFDYERSYRIAIERVIERGSLEEWQAAQAFYGKEKFLKVAAWSKQLAKRDKEFTTLFVDSAYNREPRPERRQA